MMEPTATTYILGLLALKVLDEFLAWWKKLPKYKGSYGWAEEAAKRFKERG